MTATVPRPATVSSLHAVFTAEPLPGSDPGSGSLPVPSAGLLRRFGSDDHDVDRLADRPHGHPLLRRHPLEHARTGLTEVRAEAVALAAEHDGVVVDLSVPRTVGTSVGIDLDQASQWIAVDADPAAGELTTRGLEAFGLPELLVPGVTPLSVGAMVGVVMGLGHRLIAEWPDQDPVGPATITLRDVAFGLGDPGAPATGPTRGLDLTLTYDPERERLVVTLHDDPAETLFAP